MARYFDGLDDEIRTSISSPLNISFGTVVAVFKRNGTNWNGIAALHTGPGDACLGMEIENSSQGNGLWYSAQSQAPAGVGSSFSVINSDGWCFLVVAKAEGLVPVSFWKFRYDTSTWTTETSSILVDDSPLAELTGSMRIGEWQDSDDVNGDIAAVAYFDRKLADDEVRNLPYSYLQWIESGPVGMWVLDQDATSQPIYDWTGNSANQILINGTSISTASPPIGYGASVPALVNDTDAFPVSPKFAVDIRSVGIAEISSVGIFSSEFEVSLESVGLSQNSILDIREAEFDRSIGSVSITENITSPSSSDYGAEVGSPAMQQIVPGVTLVIPVSLEIPREVVSVGITQNIAPTVVSVSLEIGREISSPDIRIVSAPIVPTPKKRTSVIRAESRRSNRGYEHRKIERKGGKF